MSVFLSFVNSVFAGTILPIILFAGGIYLGFKLKFFYVLHPIKTLKRSVGGKSSGGVSPVKSMFLALAGTLGVGNIAGVATAISAGGAGAVFWMWVSAFVAMSIKYAEVKLGVEHRRICGGEYRGGAYYYIMDGFFEIGCKKTGKVFAGVFASLMICNSLLTGNVIQVKAAADILSDKIAPIITGIVFGATGVAIAVGKVKRAAEFSSAIVPVLSVVYTFASLYIIVKNIGAIPGMLGEIISDAFDFRAVVGGGSGFFVMRSLRYGVSRGLFSNEAGMGTSPTAHAAASTDDPISQACLGIVEVFVDTVLLCTLTAFVVLLEGDKSLEGINLAIDAYRSGAGSVVGGMIAVSAVAFALASVVCQGMYGWQAVEFISDKKSARYSYIALGAFASVVGAVISSGVMWELADALVAAMCLVNICVVLKFSIKKTNLPLDKSGK